MHVGNMPALVYVMVKILSCCSLAGYISFIPRKLVLSDVGRYIAPDGLLNKIVFDMDAVVSSDDCLGETTRMVVETVSSAKTISKIKSADDLGKSHGSVQEGGLITSRSHPDFRQTSAMEDNPLAIGEPHLTQNDEEELPYLCFSSLFESGNLRTAIQVSLY